MRSAIIAMLALAPPAFAAPPVRVQVVGCPADGQQGPQPAPRGGSRLLPIPAAAGARLALYVTDDDAVLAPRGWHCLGMVGSNGGTLLVTPGRIDWARATGKAGITGPAVQRSVSLGGTSGRFEVAEIAARLFPSARRFVDGVEAEGILDHKLVRAPFPRDALLEHSATHVRFITPAHGEGLGTQSRLAADARPIDGLVILHPKDDMDLTTLAVRLPPEQRDLSLAIIDWLERAEP